MLYYKLDQDAENRVREISKDKDVNSDAWALATCIVALLNRADEEDTSDHEANE